MKKAFKWKSKWISTDIHYRGSPWGSRTQQHPYCLRYAHSHHIESHLGKKQPQAKIAIAFLFGQLHFNDVTSHALFYGGHFVMRSKRCAVQNQGITLSPSTTTVYAWFAFYPSMRFTLSLQPAFYTQSAFYPWSAVCSPQSAVFVLHWPII